MTPSVSLQHGDAHGATRRGAVRPTVLVVEDDQAVSSLLGALLEEHGFDVLEATDGVEALRLARHSAPSLIVLHLGMSTVDGHEVMRRLKADPETREVPLVAISAFTQVLPSGDRRKLTYLLGKPYELDEILSLVEATVGNPYL
ncbi:MAG: response regulator [Chloroflexota bacterium]